MYEHLKFGGNKKSFKNIDFFLYKEIYFLLTEKTLQNKLTQRVFSNHNRKIRKLKSHLNFLLNNLRKQINSTHRSVSLLALVIICMNHWQQSYKRKEFELLLLWCAKHDWTTAEIDKSDHRLLACGRKKRIYLKNCGL